MSESDRVSEHFAEGKSPCELYERSIDCKPCAPQVKWNIIRVGLMFTTHQLKGKTSQT